MLPDITDLQAVGGAIQNYSDVVDPTTDEDAKFRNFYVNDVVQASRVLQRGIFSFVGVNNADPVPAAVVHDAVWGNEVAYRPAIVRTGEGVWEATVPAQVTQPSLRGKAASIGGGITHNVNLRFGHAQCACSDGTLRTVVVEMVTANKVRIRGFVGTVADDLVGQTITCWVY